MKKILFFLILFGISQANKYEVKIEIIQDEEKNEIENKTVDFGNGDPTLGRVLNLNDEDIFCESFLDLIKDQPFTVIVRVNRGPNEQFYNLTTYYGENFNRINQNFTRKKDIKTSKNIKSEDFYLYHKNDDEKAFLLYLGNIRLSNYSYLKKLAIYLGAHDYSDTANYPIINYLIGCSLYNHDDLIPEAAHYLKQALNSECLGETDTVDCKFKVGVCLSYLKQNQEAVRYLTQTLNSGLLRERELAFCKFRLAICLMRLQLYPEGKYHIREALNSGYLSQDELAICKFHIGVYLFLTGQKEEAERLLRETIGSRRLNEDDSISCKLELAKCLWELHKYQEAEPYFTEVINSGKLEMIDFAACHFLLANCLYHQKQAQEAVRYYKATLSFGPTLISERCLIVCKIEVADCLHRLNRDREAEPYLREILNSGKLTHVEDIAQCNLQLAECLVQLSNYQEAKQYFTQILSLEIESFNKKFAINGKLGLTLYHLNEYEDAIKYLDTAKNVCSSDSVAVVVSFYKVKCLIQLHHFDRAFQELQNLPQEKLDRFKQEECALYFTLLSRNLNQSQTSDECTQTQPETETSLEPEIVLSTNAENQQDLIYQLGSKRNLDDQSCSRKRAQH